MGGQQRKKDSLAGGFGILAAVGWLCLRELKRVETRLKEKTEKKKRKEGTQVPSLFQYAVF